MFTINKFQKLCQEADNKREEMKWLVQKLDSLTSNRNDQEASSEQNKLQQLINRYKNLIPTIDITMTKTDIYSKSYIYKKEVREVCTLLKQVLKQTTETPKITSRESVQNALMHHETCLNQLEYQRANIVSMLQRGKDLLKDNLAPNFISNEVQQLEQSWNETYSQNVETLQFLKNSRKLWMNYENQKDEIMQLINQAENDLQKLKNISYYNANQVSADLHCQLENNSSLRKMAMEMIKKLQESQYNLIKISPPEQHSNLKAEFSNVEQKLTNTLKQISDQIEKLHGLQLEWNKFQSQMSELQNWISQSTQSVVDVKTSFMLPQERILKIETFQKQIHEKQTVLNVLEEQYKSLIKGALT